MHEAARLVFTDRWAARRRAAWGLVYRLWWVPAFVLIALIWHTYGLGGVL